MFIHRSAAILFLLAAIAGVIATPTNGLALNRRHGDDDDAPMPMPSATTLPAEHTHSSHVAPLLELNETEVLLHHAPDPPSYWSYDFGDGDDPKWKGLMTYHAFGMSLAFFFILPISIAFRSANHRARRYAHPVFLFFVFTSWVAGTLYKKYTPNLYEGSSHGTHGYWLLLLVSILATIDAFPLVRRVYEFLRTSPHTFQRFWESVVMDRDSSFHNTEDEYTGLVAEPEEAELDAETKPQHSTTHPYSNWANDTTTGRPAPRTRTSIGSDTTLHEPPSPTSPSSPVPLLSVAPSRLLSRRTGSIVFATFERLLVFFAFSQLLTGIVVYTGACRQNYLNGCLAHLIKGGIFWAYGILTFARYLGAYGDLGWAWNRIQTAGKRPPSAELIECSVIFLYGATNTWMERFGAAPGSPFTAKQVQHISIAVMFWFCGLVGIGLESRRVRTWLSNASSLRVDTGKEIMEPPSYIASFNPFPALAIGITGMAMSAHHQTYVFQVQIHALWGGLLGAFAVFRCLTYIFLWLRPPRSVLPSRPPTEALASFFLATGGLEFIFSTEQVGFAAMRRGHADVMMFLNLGCAITCFTFAWCLVVITVKGWAVSRVRQRRPIYVA